MMMADYRLHREYRLPAVPALLSLPPIPLPSFPCLLCGSVVPIAKFTLTLLSPSFAATAVPINDFNYMRISRVYS